MTQPALCRYSSLLAITIFYHLFITRLNMTSQLASFTREAFTAGVSRLWPPRPWPALQGGSQLLFVERRTASGRLQLFPVPVFRFLPREGSVRLLSLSAESASTLCVPSDLPRANPWVKTKLLQGGLQSVPSSGPEASVQLLRLFKSDRWGLEPGGLVEQVAGAAPKPHCCPWFTVGRGWRGHSGKPGPWQAAQTPPGHLRIAG